jgi:hypothetical protein
MPSTNTSLIEINSFLSTRNERARKSGETSAHLASFRYAIIAKIPSTADDAGDGLGERLQAHSIGSDQAFRKILRSRMLAEKTERFIGQNELVVEPTPLLAKRRTKFIKSCRSRRNPLKSDQL